MSAYSDHFAQLMQALRGGSQDAVAELLDRYGGHLYRIVRRRLHENLRSEFDSADFVQSVWGSFFTRPEALDKIESPDELLGYLVRMARNKVVSRCRRRLGRPSRDPANASFLPTEYPLTPVLRSIPAAGPTPSETAVAHEEWDRFLRGKPLRFRRMFEMRASGATLKEIARALQLSEKTVRRVIRNVQEQAQS